MKIPSFWARQNVNGVVAYGWSFTSQAEAEENARVSAVQIADRLAAGILRDRGKMYYADRPVREPIMREFRDRVGEVNALVTRNIYGALVLNTANALFVDVDFPEAKKKPPTPLVAEGCLALFTSLFPAKWIKPPSPAPGAVPPPDPTVAIINRAHAWAEANRPWQWRIYRTKAGIRLLATHALFETDSPVVPRVFEALGADLLYRKLCGTQQCFRARLTPKPWRCNYTAPTTRWPFATAEAEQEFNEWWDAYLFTCKQYATCELVEIRGDVPMHPDLTEIVAFHDASTRVGSGLPLA